MPHELIPLFAIFATFGSVIAVIKMSLDYKRAKLEALRGGSSLGTSELKTLIREAVREANAPLLTHIRELERQVDQPRELDAAPALRQLPPIASLTEVDRLTS